MPILLLLLLALLPCVQSDAAEIPLTSPVFGPAALAQYGPRAASDGDGYLVLWEDGRANRQQTLATRVSRDGQVLDPTGIPIVNGVLVNPQVVWTGESYLLVWGSYDDWTTSMLRIGRDGHVIDGPRVLLEKVVPSSVATNGTHVVVAYQAAGSMRALFLDRAARPVADVRLAPGDGERGLLHVTVSGGHFTATWLHILVPYVWNGARGLLEGIRFDLNGPIDAAPRTLIDAPYIVDPVLASDGNGYVVVARDASNLLYSRAVSADLSTVSEATVLPEPILEYLSLLWTGNEYVLVGQGGTLRAQRIDRQGRPAGESASFDDPVFTGSAWAPVVATNGRDLLVAWNGADTYNSGTALDVYGTLVSASSLARRGRSLLSMSAPRQIRPLVAFGGTNLLAVWLEGPGLWAKRLNADGTALDAAPLFVAEAQVPAEVIFNGTDYLLSWFDYVAREIVTRRIPRDGALRVDGGSRVATPNGVDSFALASNGEVTMLAWNEYDAVKAVRLRADGTLVDATPLAIVDERLVGDIGIAANGNEFFVTWGTLVESAHDFHVGPLPESIQGARVTKDLQLLDANGIDIATSDAYEADPAVAWNGREWLVIWLRASDEIRARRVAANGTLADSIASDDGILIARKALQPEITWDGSRYLLAWIDRTQTRMRMRTAWLTHPGTPLLGDTIISNGDIEWAARMTVAPIRPGHFAAAYARIAGEPQYGGVARAFVTFVDLPATRRRAVR